MPPGRQAELEGGWPHELRPFLFVAYRGEVPQRQVAPLHGASPPLCGWAAELFHTLQFFACR